MESKKPLTLDDLALLMQQGFASVHTEMNERFDGVNEQFKGVNERLDAVEEQGSVTQESVQGLATHMDKRFDVLHAEMASKDFVERKAEAQSTKTHVLVNILKGKNVLTPQEAVDVIRA